MLTSLSREKIFVAEGKIAIVKEGIATVKEVLIVAF